MGNNQTRSTAASPSSLANARPRAAAYRWLLAAAVAACSAPALAQLEPERLYNGVGRPLVVQISVPEGVEGGVEIVLFERPGGAVVARSGAAAGRADLAGLFPSLWAGKSSAVLYAQLTVGGRGVGSPVVLDPMVNPDRARLVDPATVRPTFDPARGKVVFDSDRPQAEATAGVPAAPEGFSDAPVYAGIRAYPARFIVWETSLGEASFRLRPDQAPNTAFWHLHLVEGGFYNEIEFHRVVNALDDGRRFVIQVGDPTSTGNGGPGFDFDLERPLLAHRFGVLSMARAGDPDTNGSQVFVALSREGTARLDDRYAAFGELISGAPVINAIATVGVDAEDRPVQTVLLHGVRAEPAPPMQEWPSPVTDPTAPAEKDRADR
ncbi:MAG: peptidyl-prolyl cis-trans isomerase B (cyclophilin B) [Phycisphaerales bacterium]|jgi:peptidyl-prolyl cis-trans isomerase B (cyclophilin B)